MFSLIITIISIALVAALALATLYYGGDAFKRGAASADATKLYVQAQQLQGAAELYRADTGAYPLTLEVLLEENYLKSVPVSGLDFMQESGHGPALLPSALAAGITWEMVTEGYPVFAVILVTPAVCEAVNRKAYGIAGILKSARAAYATQCFGPDLENLTVVNAKSGEMLIAASLSPLAIVDLGTVLTSALPAVDSGDMTDAGWLTVGGVTVEALPPPVVVPPAVQNPELTFFDALAPSSIAVLTLAATEIGMTSAQTQVSLKNTGAIAVTLASGGPSVPAPFGVANSTCAGATLAPGASCAVSLTFAPTSAIEYSGIGYALSITDSAGTPFKLPVIGTGTPSMAQTLTVDLSLTRQANEAVVSMTVKGVGDLVSLNPAVGNVAILQGSLVGAYGGQGFEPFNQLNGRYDLNSYYNENNDYFDSQFQGSSHSFALYTLYDPFVWPQMGQTVRLAGEQPYGHATAFTVDLTPTGAQTSNWCVTFVRNEARFLVPSRDALEPLWQGTSVAGTCP